MPAPLAATHLPELVELVHHLDPPGPCAVGVRSDGGRVELIVRRLDRGDPALSLAGFTAPPEWEAFVVRVGATEPAHPGSTIVHVVTRTGRQRTDGSTAPPQWVSDVCRRVLGLATPEATAGTADLLAAFWLDAIMGLVLDADLGDPPPGWARCRALLGPLDDEPLHLLGARVAQRVSWADVHRWATTRPLCGVPCATASWFDIGSYARFVLGLYGPLDEVRSDIGELLAPATAGALEAVLEQWPLGPDR